MFDPSRQYRVDKVDIVISKKGLKVGEIDLVVYVGMKDNVDIWTWWTMWIFGHGGQCDMLTWWTISICGHVGQC